MTREQLGVLRDARDKLCGACNAVECETCYVPRLIERHEREVTEAATVAHGRWIEKNWNWYCSQCNIPGYKGFIPAFPDEYCPHCGAKMDSPTKKVKEQEHEKGNAAN